jgi:hypothetical protein
MDREQRIKAQTQRLRFQGHAKEKSLKVWLLICVHSLLFAFDNGFDAEVLLSSHTVLLGISLKLLVVSALSEYQ